MSVSSDPLTDIEIAGVARFHQWRKFKDKIARRLISFGGISVILAVVLIFFYLIYVVFPLFLSADAQNRELGTRSDWVDSSPVYTTVEEQLKVGLRVNGSGVADFFSVDGLENIASQELLTAGQLAVASAESAHGNGIVAIATDDGRVLVFQHLYNTNFDNGVENRVIVPSLVFPYGNGFRDIAPSESISTLAISDNDAGLIIAAVVGRTIHVEMNSKQQNFLTGLVNLLTDRHKATVEFDARSLAISGDHRWLYAADGTGQIHVFSLPALEPLQVQKISAVAFTSMKMLLGGISVMAGDASGKIYQLFPVRDKNNDYTLELIRQFDNQQAAITKLLPEQRRKGFIALDASGTLGIYHSTAGQMVYEKELSKGVPVGAALSPRANGLILFDQQGGADLLEIDNEHPEVSLKAIWQKVWYENYPEPDYVWQSSASSNEFEPKFSLSPLVFGTMKAALFAMLFAVPLALMGAAFTAYFMAPKLREVVKPSIEIMAALPTVILGFLAGLWLAPFIENNLASIALLMLILPVGLLLFAYWWSHYQGTFKSLVPEGWEPALLLPVIVFLVFVSLTIANPVQQFFFGGDLRTWLSQELGVSYDQRNAIVVGFAMGFAVIPTVFSMSEDAIFGVPQTLSNGSLALGATPWQTMVRVILPTASPAIFSALMIGLGRAVGETMIVLMATGNTPVMDWSVFEGMRTLAANIAVEMPESEVNGSHYRILFLAALVLFMFTFVVNTVAEIIRQRLRERYSSL